MKCELCDDQRELPVVKEYIIDHLIVTKDKFGHYHIHGPLEDREEVITMLSHICYHAKINLRTLVEPKVKGVPVTEEDFMSPEQKRFKRYYSTSLLYNKRVA